MKPKSVSDLCITLSTLSEELRNIGMLSVREREEKKRLIQDIYNEIEAALSIQTVVVGKSPEPDDYAPDGSEIRLLPTMKRGGLCHCTLPAGKTSRPVAHHHVEEIWYILEGQGEVWRGVVGAKDPVPVSAGTSLTIPPRTPFQFRNTGTGPLCILIATMPPWPGPQEAEEVEGFWTVGEAQNGS